MWLKIMHAIGLTNLSDHDVARFEDTDSSATFRITTSSFIQLALKACVPGILFCISLMFIISCRRSFISAISNQVDIRVAEIEKTQDSALIAMQVANKQQLEKTKAEIFNNITETAREELKKIVLNDHRLVAETNKTIRELAETRFKELAAITVRTSVRDKINADGAELVRQALEERVKDLSDEKIERQVTSYADKNIGKMLQASVDQRVSASLREAVEAITKRDYANTVRDLVRSEFPVALSDALKSQVNKQVEATFPEVIQKEISQRSREQVRVAVNDALQAVVRQLVKAEAEREVSVQAARVVTMPAVQKAFESQFKTTLLKTVEEIAREKSYVRDNFRAAIKTIVDGRPN